MPTDTAVHGTHAMPSTDIDRQTDLLITKGYHALAGLTETAFRDLIAPLARLQPPQPFVLVVTAALVPAHVQITRAALEHKRAGRKAGFTTMDADDLARFRPTADVVLPPSPVYLAAGIDTGGDTLNVAPDDALPGILAAGRTPLTLEEGLAVAVQHPSWLRERNCFEMLGSRAGDKRVTGIWVSKGAPRLGWCWGGNPHTWLGMATATTRLA